MIDGDYEEKKIRHYMTQLELDEENDSYNNSTEVSHLLVTGSQVGRNGLS